MKMVSEVGLQTEFGVYCTLGTYLGMYGIQLQTAE